MNESLAKLLDSARKVRPSAADREQQRRSFAYGNTHFENERITREMVDRAADEIAKEKKRATILVGTASQARHI